MHRSFPLASFLLGLTPMLWAFAASAPQEERPIAPLDAPVPHRIVSLAPNVTEILFCLELGDRVVGVTRYCDYPEEAKGIAKVGGFMDPSFEAIVSLNPDLVILLTSHRDTQVGLQAMSLRTLSVPHTTVSDVHESIRMIGEACGVSENAEALLRKLRQRNQAVIKAVTGRHRPRTMVVINRDTGSGRLSGMFIAGKDGFFDELISLAGGENACTDFHVSFPQISAEGVLKLDPDVIIDLVSLLDPDTQDPKILKQQWDILNAVQAVRDGRVHVISGDHALRPGPRYIDFLEQLAVTLHPDIVLPRSDHD